jgi:hypothetical protein
MDRGHDRETVAEICSIDRGFVFGNSFHFKCLLPTQSVMYMYEIEGGADPVECD